MTDKLENLIRQWGQSAEGEVGELPGPPTPACLTYPQAEQAARGQPPPSPPQTEHIQSCDYCRRLLADFREAIKDASILPQPVDAMRPVPILRLWRSLSLAAAAAILLALGLFLVYRPGQPTLLASADVGLASEIDSGLTPKGPKTFTTGQAIKFRLELNRDSFVTLINIDSRGKLTALPADPSAAGPVQKMNKGTAVLGPYRLVPPAGTETFIVVVSRRTLSDLPGKLDTLQAARDQGKGIDSLTEMIRGWPAEAVVIGLTQAAPGGWNGGE